MATDSSPVRGVARRAIAELTVTDAQDDLLSVQPLDLGAGQPGTAALELERGPQPAAISRDDRQ